MSQMRQSPIVPVHMSRPVVALGVSYGPGARIPRHRHRSAQLIAAISGVMTVTTRDGRFVVPPQRGVWVPPLTEHRIRMTGEVAMRTVYFSRALATKLPQQCCVVQVTPLLRELVLRAVELARSPATPAHEARIRALIFDEVKQAKVAPLHLPLPADARALRVTRALHADPGDQRSIAGFAKLSGASPRTLARLFRRETGMSFGAWRQQLRLLRALERLAAGDPVMTAALELGYDSPSAFIAMFKRTLGVSPGRYFDAGQ
jgi:AraC-like DNA-binding protein/quercetin dioxygenase-like cupin family protein